MWTLVRIETILQPSLVIQLNNLCNPTHDPVEAGLQFFFRFPNTLENERWSDGNYLRVSRSVWVHLILAMTLHCKFEHNTHEQNTMRRKYCTLEPRRWVCRTIDVIQSCGCTFSGLSDGELDDSKLVSTGERIKLVKLTKTLDAGLIQINSDIFLTVHHTSNTNLTYKPDYLNFLGYL